MKRLNNFVWGLTSLGLPIWLWWNSIIFLRFFLIIFAILILILDDNSYRKNKQLGKEK